MCYQHVFFICIYTHSVFIMYILICNQQVIPNMQEHLGMPYTAHLGMVILGMVYGIGLPHNSE